MTVQETTTPRPGAASRVREAALGLVFVCIGVLVLVLARSIDAPMRETAVSSRIWPEALGIGIIGLSLLQLVLAVWRPTVDSDAEEPATRTGIARVVGFVVIVLLFGALWYVVHFLVSGFALVAALTWVAGGRGLRDLLLFPAAITAVLYGLFALLLKVPV